MATSRVIVVFALLFAFSVPCIGQPNVARYFDDSSFSMLDLSDYLQIKFTWTIKGKLQVILNEGINELDEGNVSRANMHFDEFIQTDSTFWPAFYYRGVCRKKIEDYRGAEKDFLKVMQLQPSAFQPLVELGEIYQEDRQFAKARKLYNQAEDIEPKRVEPLFAQASVALSLNETGKGKRMLERCLDIKPDFAPAFVYLGILKYRDNKKALNENLEWFEKAIKADSTFRPAYFWKGMVFIYGNRLEDALQTWSKLVALMNENPLLLQMRGYLLIDLGRFDDAFNDFRKSLAAREYKMNGYMDGRTRLSKQIDLQKSCEYLSRKGYGLSDETFSLLKRSFCLMLIEKDQDALRKLTEAERIEPSSACYLLKAVAFDHIKEHDSAVVNYTKALKIDKDVYVAHWKLAIHHFELKNYKTVYGEMMEMKRLEPNAPSTSRLMGFLKTEMKDYYGCIIDLTKFIDQDSSDLQVFRKRAFCFSQVKDYKHSTSDYRYLISQNISDKQSHLSIYANQMLSGDTLAALATLKKVSALWPVDGVVTVSIADIYVHLKYYDSAAWVIDPLLRSINYLNLSYKSDALFVYAKALAGQKYYESAIDKLDQAIKLDASNTEKIFFRAVLALASGDEKSAIKDLRKLREMGFEATAYYDRYLKE